MSWTIEMKPLPAMRSSLPCGFERFHNTTIHCFGILLGCNFGHRKSYWLPWRICNVENPARKNVPLEWNCFSIDSQQLFVTKRTHWILPLDLPKLSLHLCCQSSFPSIDQNLSNHVLLLLSTGSLDRGTILISSMREMHSQSCSNINFCVILNKLWHSSKFVFL